MTGMLGGGLQVRELNIPKIGKAVRAAGMLVGLLFVGVCFSIQPDQAAPNPIHATPADPIRFRIHDKLGEGQMSEQVKVVAVEECRGARMGGCSLLPAPHPRVPKRGGKCEQERLDPELHMVIRVVRLGSPRAPDEGTRIGTVRRPPRGVPKAEFATRNWYDVWFPNLAPGAETHRLGQEATTPAEWATFIKKYRSEMSTPHASHSLELLAALSQHGNFSVGCYCENEERCHRSVLRALLVEKGAKVR